MRDPNRIEDVLARLKVIWDKNPDLRLGQLICNAVPAEVLYFAEDDELIEAVEELYNNIES